MSGNLVSSPFKGEARRGTGYRGCWPHPTLALPLKGKELRSPRASHLHAFTVSLHTQMLANTFLGARIRHHPAVHDFTELEHSVAIRYCQGELHVLLDQ